MSFEKVHIINSDIVSIPADNINTVKIVSNGLLKIIRKESFFREKKYIVKNSPAKDFILSKSDGSEKILVVGSNFEGGADSGYVAQKLYDHGFRAVISSSFAEAFKNGALNIGLLPVEISEGFLLNIFAFAKKDPAIRLFINLINQKVTIEDSGESETFKMSKFRKQCLLNGENNLDYLLNIKPKIEEFETKRKQIQFIKKYNKISS